jgi:hypothetical protein
MEEQGICLKPRHGFQIDGINFSNFQAHNYTDLEKLRADSISLSEF